MGGKGVQILSGLINQHDATKPDRFSSKNCAGLERTPGDGAPFSLNDRRYPALRALPGGRNTRRFSDLTPLRGLEG